MNMPAPATRSQFVALGRAHAERCAQMLHLEGLQARTFPKVGAAAGLLLFLENRAWSEDEHLKAMEELIKAALA